MTLELHSQAVRFPGFHIEQKHQRDGAGWLDKPWELEGQDDLFFLLRIPDIYCNIHKPQMLSIKTRRKY